MILPTKHMPVDKALLSVGSKILKHLDRQKTISALWEETIVEYSNKQNGNPEINYDWFVLALDFLYAIDTIEIKNGLLCRRAS